MDYTEIGTNIKLCRIRQSVKQAKLAEMIDVTEQHISHIECGRTKMSLAVLVQIAEVLNVSIYTLLGSNVQTRPNSVLDAEISEIFKNASQSQRELCVKLCRAVVE